MIWLIILAVFLGLIFWILFSPILIEIDTRVPLARVSWKSIGNLILEYNDHWQLNFRVLFFSKTIYFKGAAKRPLKPKHTRRAKKKSNPRRIIRGVVRMIKSFRVTEWKLSIDTGDHVWNAQMYPLNYLPQGIDHLNINFIDENYLVLKMRNRPWKMLRAFL